MKTFSIYAAALCALLATGTLTGCAVAVVGGAAAAGLIATDRRSLDTQLADKTIDVSASGNVRQALNGRGHVDVTSYYRKVLLTGEVPTESDRQKAVAAVQRTSDVMGVVDELAVMPASDLSQRAQDNAITAKVKINLTNTSGVPVNSIKVVTERGTTYLMGRLTHREAELATETARTTTGVQHVVRVIDFISEQAALHPNDAMGTNTTAPVTAIPATATQVNPPQNSTAGASGVSTYPVTQPPVIQQPPIRVTPLPPVK